MITSVLMTFFSGARLISAYFTNSITSSPLLPGKVSQCTMRSEPPLFPSPPSCYPSSTADCCRTWRMISHCQRNMKAAASPAQPESVCTAQVHPQVKILFQVQSNKKKKLVEAFKHRHTKQIEINIYPDAYLQLPLSPPPWCLLCDHRACKSFFRSKTSCSLESLFSLNRSSFFFFFIV